MTSSSVTQLVLQAPQKKTFAGRGGDAILARHLGGNMAFSFQHARLERLQQEYEDLRRQWQSSKGQNLETLIRLNYTTRRLQEAEAADDEQLIA